MQETSDLRHQNCFRLGPLLLYGKILVIKVEVVQCNDYQAWINSLHISLKDNDHHPCTKNDVANQLAPGDMIAIDHLNIIFIHRILSFTCRDLYDVAEEERKRSQHRDKLLSIFVNDIDGFHSFFYWSSFRTRVVKATRIVFYNAPLESCLRSDRGSEERA
jgi:hypothetical protein